MHLKWKGEASIYNNQQLEGTRHDKKKTQQITLTACFLSTLPTSAPTAVGIFGRASCTWWLFLMITKERENKKKENKGKRERADDTLFIVLCREMVSAFRRHAYL
jgi:hypothetical protein